MLELLEHLCEVGVVEVGIFLFVQHDKPVGGALRERMCNRTVTVAVDEPHRSMLSVAFLEPSGLAVADTESHGCLPETELPLYDMLEQPGTPEFFPAHQDLPLHAHLLRSHEEDIFSLQLMRT